MTIIGGYEEFRDELLRLLKEVSPRPSAEQIQEYDRVFGSVADSAPTQAGRASDAEGH